MILVKCHSSTFNYMPSYHGTRSTITPGALSPQFIPSLTANSEEIKSALSIAAATSLRIGVEAPSTAMIDQCVSRSGPSGPCGRSGGQIQRRTSRLNINGHVCGMFDKKTGGCGCLTGPFMIPRPFAPEAWGDAGAMTCLVLAFEDAVSGFLYSSVQRRVGAARQIRCSVDSEGALTGTAWIVVMVVVVVVAYEGHSDVPVAPLGNTVWAAWASAILWLI